MNPKPKNSFAVILILTFTIGGLCGMAFSAWLIEKSFSKPKYSIADFKDRAPYLYRQGFRPRPH